MDDEDELKDFNLSSRVVREERRRKRERSRLQRELERERTNRDSSSGSRDRDTGASRDSVSDFRGGAGGGTHGEDPAADGATSSTRGSTDGSSYPGTGYGNWEKSLKAKEDEALSSTAEGQLGPANPGGDEQLEGVADEQSWADGNDSVELSRDGALDLSDVQSADDWVSGGGEKGNTRGRNWEWREGQSSRCASTLHIYSSCY